VAKHIGYNQRTKVDNKWELGEHHKEHVANHIGGYNCIEQMWPWETVGTS
jgi:hypothetical protein